MDKQEVEFFLNKCGISQDRIQEFFTDKKIIEKEGNVFLSGEDFSNNQVFDDVLLFISLEELIPSRYLLDYIKQHTKNIVKIKSDKQVQRILYGEDLSKDAVPKHLIFEKGKNYIVTLEGKPLGIVEYLGIGKFSFKNIYNLGQYLREGN